MDKFFAAVDASQETFIKRLTNAVAIASVSADIEHRAEVFQMSEFLIKELEAVGVKVEKRHPGKQQLNGHEIDLPPVLLGSYGNDPAKKTVLVYGHYDVQPALLEDGWLSDPFKLVKNDKDQLVGRGSSDDKGPVLAWINALEAYKKAGIELPINIKFCLEGMEESGSEGLDDIIRDEADKYFSNVDCVCISDNYWLGTTIPCVTYGLRGVSYFEITVAGPSKDLHSGLFGGTLYEPMTDLTHLMASLVQPNGTINIPGIMDQVAPLTKDEEKLYGNLSFSMQELYNALGSTTSIHESHIDTLMHRWRYPSLSLHGIEGAFSAPGSKTVIPAKVKGKFSIRTVPDMDPEQVTKLVQDYLSSVFASLNSKNEFNVTCAHTGKPWTASVDHYNYVAAAKAVEEVFGVKPEYTREGGSIPVTLTFQEALKCSVLLLPMGRADDGAHSIQEKLDVSNYISGTKMLGAYLYQLSKV